MTDPTVSPVLTARCYCGAVVMRCSMPPRSVIHCHCNQCRRQSGAAFTTWVSLRRQATAIDGEDFLASHEVSANGTRHFCKRCGSHMFSVDLQQPKMLGVPAGVIDEAASLVPLGHYFVSHKAARHEIMDWCRSMVANRGMSLCHPAWAGSPCDTDLMSTSTPLLSLFKYKAAANEELFAEMAKVDAAAHEAERHTAIRILNHIHVVDRIFAGHLSGVPHGYTATNTPQTPTLDELRQSVADTDQWYVSHVQSLAPEQFAQKLSFVFTDGQNATMSREEMLLHVSTHGAYHRGAVGRILAQLGIAPPRDLLTRYLHIAEPERRQIAAA